MRGFLTVVHLIRPLLVVVALAVAMPLWAQSGSGDASDAEAPGFEELVGNLQTHIEESTELRGQLEARLAEVRGPAAMVLEHRIESTSVAAFNSAHELAELVIEREAAGEDTGTYLELTSDFLQRNPDRIMQRLDELLVGFNLDKPLSEMSAAEQVALEADREELTERVLILYEALFRNLSLSEQLGLESRDQAVFLDQALLDTSANTSVALELSQKYQRIVVRQLKTLPQDPEFTALANVAAERVQRHHETLRRLVQMMEQRELGVVQYRQQLVTTAGTVTADLLDVEVFTGLVHRWLLSVSDWARENLPSLVFNILLFLLIVWVAATLASLTRRLVNRALDRVPANISELLRRMIVSIAGNLVLLLGILFGLAQLGISVGPLLAGLGIAGFIVGFALQDTLGNFASGMMILLYRPYDVGDVIETNGLLGKVSKMSLVNTTVLTIDNQTLVLPNNKIWSDVIKNITAQKHRRVDMVFGIGYSDDAEQAGKVLEDILRGHSKVLEEPEPIVRLHTLNESSVDFVVRPWVLTEDYWDVYWDVTSAVKARFDEAAISIPFPQRDIHLYTAGVSPTPDAIGMASEQTGVAPTGSQAKDDDPDDAPD